ncbi:hypothetical protein PH235_10335 [Trichococcus sp. K1Tr]|uniref:Flp family type IVb pilin n=1 Tax=Trichococcus sp. K1Tr TaxID=3020847 RepID=UPI00232B2E72|nr:hypothetical protein [Trichococcus sp. K1Tr]MDB6353956.1 hypothetical protein [Trichococcus sp. K1Tr]
MEIMKRLFTEEEGQGLVEYVMILAVVVAIGAVISSTNLGNTISASLSNLVSKATTTK